MKVLLPRCVSAIGISRADPAGGRTLWQYAKHWQSRERRRKKDLKENMIAFSVT
jgi:hypothetical protein